MLTNPEDAERPENPEVSLTPPAPEPRGPAPIEGAEPPAESASEPTPPSSQEERPPSPSAIFGEEPGEEEGPEETRQAKAAKKMAAGLGAIFIGVVLTTALVYFFMAIQNSRLQNLTSSYDSEVKIPLAAMKETEDEVMARADQITTFKESLSNLVLWSELLKELTSTTYKKAKFTALNVSEAGEIKVDGEVDNFVDLGKTIQALKASKRFKEVQLTSTGVNTDSKKVNFSLGFKIDLQSLTKERLKLSVPATKGSTEESATPAETIPASETSTSTNPATPPLTP